MLNFTEEEINTLYSILITEYHDIEDLLDKVGEADKKELLQELEKVNSMINKIKDYDK